MEQDSNTEKKKVKKNKIENLPTWIIAIVAVLTFILTLVQSFPMIIWFIGASVLIVIIGLIIFIGKRKAKWLQIIPIMNFILKVLITSVGTGILSLAVSIFYTYNLSTKLVGIVKVEGNEIANKVENTILEDVREGDEKVILTLVDSETVRNRVYQDALGQAKAKTYIDFVDGRYQFQKKWNILRYKLTEDKNSVDERFIITLIDDTNDIDKNVSLFFSEVLLRFPGDMGKLLEKSGRERSILLTEDEQDAIEVCFNKHKDEADLFSLINLVLSDPNVIKELEKKEAYDLEYYEVQDYTKGDQIKKDEKIASISDSNVVIVIKKTNRNLTPYDKIGIIGSFLDSLRFQNASQ